MKAGLQHIKKMLQNTGKHLNKKKLGTKWINPIQSNVVFL